MSNKFQRKQEAEQHTIDMQIHYAKEILRSTKQTKIYDTASIFKTPTPIDTAIQVIDTDTISATLQARLKNPDHNISILNFASYRYPGGSFLNGSMAQEEAICQASNLYNILINFDSNFYAKNRKDLNHNLYKNVGLFTPDVIFQTETHIFSANVITVPAPNKTATLKNNISNDKIRQTLDSRIKFLLNIASDNQTDTLILGAFGCGVFGQDPNDVAQIFKKYLTSTHTCFKNIIFAVPKTKSKKNYNTFYNNFN